LILVAVVLAIKTVVLLVLCRAFGNDWQTSIRTAFALSQVGEFAFVLFTASAAAGLLSSKGVTLGFLVIAVSMILTPILFQVGERIASRFRRAPELAPSQPAETMDRHLVIVGLDEVGKIIALMAKQSELPYIAFDREYSKVGSGKQAGWNVHFGDITSSLVQEAAGLARAKAVFVSATDEDRVRAIAISLHQRYPNLDIYARVSTVREEAYLRSKGIQHAATVYIESTLVRGYQLLKDLGVPEDQAETLVENLRGNEYALIKSAVAQQ
jgi:glutathione-regulated potassium-efflux system protein KefB